MRAVTSTLAAGADSVLSPYDDAAFLRMMLASVPAFVVLLDAELMIRYINRLQPGFKLEDVLGRSTFDFIEPRHHELHRAAIEEAWRTGRVTSYTTIRGDGGEGRVAYYDQRLVPLGEPGSRTSLCVIALDVTDHVERGEALRESEEKLRLAVSATGIGLWSWEIASDKIEWNDRMHEITGSAEVTSPASYLERLVHPEDRARLEREIKLIQSGVPEYPAHRIIRPSDGRLRWVMAFGAQQHPGAQHERMTGAMVDVTGQRQLEEHLRAVQKMDAIGALTAGVAHNFNNMLAVIIPAVELALRTINGTEHRLLSEAAHAAHRAADLVAQLMTFAGQRKAAERGPIDVADVVERAVSMCQRAFDRQIEIAVVLDGGLPRVQGEAAGLEQVLVNALINARDAIASAQPASARIVVRCSRVHTSLPPGMPREHVRIAIEDNGIGMSDAVIGRLFEPFFTTKEPGKGTGLGLATSYAIVREHGGFISYSSEERVGTTCEVFLPCAGSEPPVHASPLPRDDGVKRRGRIMVIDDEPAIRSVVRDALALDGHESVLAADGQEAIERLESAPLPDLILFDRSMPGRGPLHTLAEIRKRAPSVPVLFFTGESVPVTERALVQGVLQKPLALSELAETVQRWLRK
jgi:two-component system cell cycle sensor histidine kinase/response regulator CckA